MRYFLKSIHRRTFKLISLIHQLQIKLLNITQNGNELRHDEQQFRILNHFIQLKTTNLLKGGALQNSMPFDWLVESINSAQRQQTQTFPPMTSSLLNMHEFIIKRTSHYLRTRGCQRRAKTTLSIWDSQKNNKPNVFI